ncbi:DMT family transporter [Variovorax sp. RB3P1]|uniref:DMT family transporter n=1 Tax=Variovorax sp. RB3P1 TaxID=3443732 RepID=UPI003F46EC8B
MSTPPQHLSRHAPLTALTVLLLLVPPLLWASNAVVGRMVRDLVSPVTLNFVRWIIAFVLLLPLAAPVLRRGSPLWAHWKRYAVLGLLGIGLYNAFQYLALQTSTPINTTLVGSSLPLWMLAVGTLFFGARVNAREIGGALLSMAGVLLVLSRGEWRQLLGLRLVPGDLYMIAGTIAWAFYSWLLARTHEPKAVRQDWAAFLMAQLVFGLAWSGALAAGEWTLTDAHIDMDWPLAAAMLFIGIGPALVAYRCWGTGVQRAGPQAASVFMNLTPLFAAVLSAAFLREPPHWYHGVAFLLIVGGIVVAARR